LDSLKGDNWEEWEKLYQENDGVFDKLMQLEYELGNFIK
jgi:hypothetical protein